MRASPGHPDSLLVACCIATKVLIFGLAAGKYGYLSDELYFLDASTRLAAGYVDFPPGIAWLMAFVRATLGESLWGLRLVAMLIGTASIIVAADLALIMGGGRLAQWLTAIVVLFAPGVLSVQSILTMNVLDQLWWLLAFRFLLLYLRDGRPQQMILLGLVAGFGVMSKLSMLAFGFATALALLVWEPRVLARRETWTAALVALIVIAPFIAWQVLNAWPFADFIGAYNATPPQAMVLQNPLLGLFITMNPVYSVIWVPGVVFLLASAGPGFRVAGSVAVLSLALFVLAGVKFYFAVPVIMVFAAAGGVWWEGLLRQRARLAGASLAIFLLINGLVGVPIATPVLPRERMQRLADYLRDSEAGRSLAAPAQVERYFPHFAEMHGWPELVELTTRVHAALPSGQAGGALVAAHYGQAAALNRLDANQDLPTAHSGHMSYDFWNRGADLGRGIYIGFARAELEPLFDIVEFKGRLECGLCMAREHGLEVYYVEQPRVDADKLRDAIRRYYFF